MFSIACVKGFEQEFLSAIVQRAAVGFNPWRSLPQWRNQGDDLLLTLSSKEGLYQAVLQRPVTEFLDVANYLDWI